MSARLKILVIDDEPEICELTKLLLERAGHEVLTATNGNAAIRLFNEQIFDLVITDILMPDRDGLEVIAELRRKHPAVRIIASSGGGRVSSDSYLHIARKTGAHALLAKPFTLTELHASVTAAMQGAEPVMPVSEPAN
ncbi:MAG: response regulator [Verrucomicrobia bacterium]|nr:response regulator [Verrucomicrobiota bacterium]